MSVLGKSDAVEGEPLYNPECHLVGSGLWVLASRSDSLLDFRIILSYLIRIVAWDENSFGSCFFERQCDAPRWRISSSE